LKSGPPGYTIFFAILFLLIGIFLLSSIIFSLFYNEAWNFPFYLIIIPGTFLFSSFFLAAFYVPCFLFAGAFLLLKYPYHTRRLLVLLLTIIPFLTSALFLQIISADKVQSSFPADFISRTCGAWPGALILFFLLTGEIFIISGYARHSRKQYSDSSRKHHLSEKEQLYLDFDESGSNKREFLLHVHRTHQDKEMAENTANVNASQQTEEPEKKKQTGAKIRIALPGKIKQEKEEKSILSLPEPAHKQIEQEQFFPPLLPLKENISLDDVINDTIEKVIIGSQNNIVKQTQSPEDHLDLLEDGDAAILIEEENIKDFINQPVVNGNDESDPPVKKNKKHKPYIIPVDGILKDYEDHNYWVIDDEAKNSARILMETLNEFKITAEVTGIRRGPVITMFEILPAPGVKLSKIVNLADNIALRLAASRVRIVAPIPGKHAVGIEVPNKKRAIVSFKEIVYLDAFKEKKNKIPIALGKDIAGEAQIMDLIQTPHLLIAGATGSGKSVCVNSIICSILYRNAPDEVKLLLIDPKIVELKFYNDIPHLLTPVITNPQKAYQALQYCICEMERRYSLLDAVGARDTESFNRKIVKKNLTISKLPYIVIIIDEFADLIATTGKEMEQTIARLAAMSRAVGIHLVLATQRPSVDVITGLIKANIPSRIAFMVASKFDSRIIIDCVGAEKLLGKGDMLLTSAQDPFPVRIQGAYLMEEEVEAVVEYVKTFGEPEYIDDEIFIEDDEEEEIFFGESDPLMEQALEVVVAKGKASASYLQRRLKIGYNRAARLVEDMEKRGIVGPPNGSKPRELIHIPEKK
jgi:S-DNA-T family DNA segregation ATPase FtsK/SpoIIIE